MHPYQPKRTDIILVKMFLSRPKNYHTYYYQVQHLEDNLKGISAFGQAACSTAGELAPYLLQLYFKIVTECLKKHSSHPMIDQVTFMNNFWTFNFAVH